MQTPNFYRNGFSESKILLFLFLAAIVVRVIGIDYGYIYPDERINYSAKVLSGQLVPDQHFYPPLLYYITAFAFSILYAFGRAIPVWHSIADFREQYFDDPTAFVITARFVVCLISSTIAPLFFLIAKELGFSKKSAVIPGIMAIFIPVMVIHSHYSKIDVPLSVSTILIFLLALKRIKVQKSVSLDIFLGVAFALSLSFKHSAIFTIVPFSILLCFAMYSENKNLKFILKSVTIGAIAAIVSWSIFNIGILLDFQNFLDYQKVQAVMSIRPDDGFLESVEKWWSVVTHTSFGVNLGIVVLFLAFPPLISFVHDFRKCRLGVYAFWVAIAISTLAIISFTGTRQIESLWLPHVVSMQLFASILMVSVFQFLQGWPRQLTVVMFSLVFSVSVYGTIVVMRQALARPAIDSLAEFINSENYIKNETRILTNYPMPFPQSLEGKAFDLDREKRLADRYSISLIGKADEFYNARERSLNFSVMPVVYAGLEFTEDETLGEAMKPGLWPLQEEEWFLDFWTDQGVEIIIYSAFYDELNSRETPEILSFLREIEARCRLEKHIEAVKPLFVEYSATIFYCSRLK